MFLRYRWQFTGGFAALLLTNIMGTLVPQLIQSAIHLFEKPAAQPETLQHLYGYLLAILGVAIVMMCVRLASRMFLLGVGRRIEYDLRNILYKRLLKLPLSFFTVNPTGELMSRLTNDVQAMRFLCGGAVMLTANAIFAYTARIPVMIRISPILTLCAFLVYPFAAWGMSRLSRRVKASFFKVQDILGDISTLTQENLSGINVIQGYAKEPVENRRFQRLSDNYFEANRHLIRNRVFMFLVMSAVSGLGLLITLLVGGHEAIAHHMEYSQFIQFTLYLEQLAWPTMSLGWAITILQQGGAALQRIDEVLAAPLPPIPPQEPPLNNNNLTSPPAMMKIPSGKEGREYFPAEQPLTVEIRHLSFRYENPYKPAVDPEMDGAPQVLRDISVRFSPGTLTVLVGPVGSGKSTLLQLLPQLYPVQPETVFIGGKDIHEIPLPVLRERVVLMPQQSFLFSSSIEKNIAYGYSTHEDVLRGVVQAAQTAGIHEEILGFQNQYETIVGERGMLVSGGQRQRLSLARALMIASPVLLLDDPFSNVDTETEQEILSALDTRKTFENKITVIATHRLSIARKASQVILMDQGRIVAAGSHTELLATQPLYQRLNRKEQLETQIQSSRSVTSDEP